MLIHRVHEEEKPHSQNIWKPHTVNNTMGCRNVCKYTHIFVSERVSLLFQGCTPNAEQGPVQILSRFLCQVPISYNNSIHIASKLKILCTTLYATKPESIQTI